MGWNMNFYLTFDVDLIDYLSGKKIDELDETFPSIQKVLTEFPEIRTTWFIRVDKQIEVLFGEPDFIFTKHKDKIDWLRSKGHAIGWHYHAYHLINGEWKQCLDDNLICCELERFSTYAKKYELELTRMGFGYHSGQTIQKLFDLDFSIDSTAIPRPRYSWETTFKDWTGSPNEPYYPSVEDYRLNGKNQIGILEVPITTTIIRTALDTQEVKRYINAAYRHTKFVEAIESLNGHPNIVSVTHPYELFPNNNDHQLLSFNIIDFRRNIQYLIERNFSFENDFNKLRQYANP